MKRTLLTAAICLLAACTDGGQQPGAPLNASRNGETAFEAIEGTTVWLEEYLRVTGGVPPYGYATSLQGDFSPSLERTVPAPEHSPPNTASTSATAGATGPKARWSSL